MLKIQFLAWDRSLTWKLILLCSGGKYCLYHDLKDSNLIVFRIEIWNKV